MSRSEQQWFQARLRWAVMEKGRGLDHWRGAEHIFQSDSREAAFAEALRIGHSQEYVMTPERAGDPAFEVPVGRGRVSGRKGRRRQASMCLSGKSRPPNGSASSTNSTPTAGCQNRLSDRLFSVAPPYASPKRAAKAAALGFAPAGATENRKKWDKEELLVQQGGQI